MKSLHACPLEFYFPQMIPRSVLEGYLYPPTFSCVLMDYQKALIHSAGWGLTVTLAPNIKVLEWFVRRFFPIKKKHTQAVKLPPKRPWGHEGRQPSDAEAGAWCQKCRVLPLKQDIVQFMLAFEWTGGAVSQRGPGCADVHLGTSQPITESGGEWQPSLSSSCPLTASIPLHTDNTPTLLSKHPNLSRPSSSSRPTNTVPLLSAPTPCHAQHV